jgi:hypothetical protein
MSKSKSVHVDVGFSGILQIIFIVLKLTNVISWSWVWVLSPLWISAVLIALLLIILAILNNL